VSIDFLCLFLWSLPSPARYWSLCHVTLYFWKKLNIKSAIIRGWREY
jgi:hypothetical protein